MKKLALFIALLFAFAFLLSYVKGQSELTESTSSLPTERRYHNWKMAWESSYDSQLNTSNQVPLIEQSLLQNSIEFRSIGPKKITWLKTNTAYSTNHRQQSNYFTGFEAGYSHKISRLEYTADLEVGYTRHFNFGRAGGEIAKTFRGEQLQIRPFARVDYYFPIDNFGDIRTN
ncbi:MAG TPA: hypothetical protein PKD79_03175, partial [Candidatus Doudnabacteria bacterium]|nr:hypothetical protein [Candidatus Doudnabacteria bacterium]